MSENEIESIIAGRLDKIFEDYPTTPRIEMLKIAFKQSIVKDAEMKMTKDLSMNDAIEQAFTDFGNIRHQINTALFNDKEK